MTAYDKTTAKTAAVLGLFLMTAASAVSAQTRYETYDTGPRTEFSILGGVQRLMETDTALPDDFTSVPAVASLGIRFTPIWALEGELGWLIPVEQDLEITPGVESSVRAPHVLSYQANLRADWGLGTWTPYVTAGLGAVTFLASDDADRVPRLADPETMFAYNFGAGVSIPMTSGVGLRADFRELIAVPADDQTGFSAAGEADPIWMPRGTLGLTFRF